MRCEWDEAKNEAQVALGRPSFAAILDFEWETATVERSDRYGETRWAATGYIGKRFYRIIYTMRGNNRRIISLRRASAKEIRRHAKA